MNPLLQRFLLYLLFLISLGCSDSTRPSESVSPNTALFDPTTSTVPLPNILATATAKDPITQFSDPATGNLGLRPVNTPMNPLEALAYLNLHEAGGSNAVAGLNAPIYLRFAGPLDPSTVSAANIKVFQITADSASPTSFENNPLSFSDVTGMFSFHYTAGSSDVTLFPNFPLLPATRYLYLVTNRVKDAATGGAVSGSVYFEALKSPLALTGPFAALEPIRADLRDAGNNVVLSGYAKVMTDLTAAPALTTVARPSEIVLLGRFITSSSVFIASDPVSNPIASLIPVESALRAFAAGSGLLGGLPGKSWLAAGLNAVTITTPPGLSPQLFWSGLSAGTPPASVGAVVTGRFASANISMDPVVAHNNPSFINLSSFGSHSAASAVVQPFRDPVSQQLAGFYHKGRAIPFIYLAPAGTAPSGGWPLVIFQHGINGQKEQVVAVAGALTAAGFAVVAIDLPLHGALALPGHLTGAEWGQDFIALGAPLAARSNIQQAAFNLHRLELIAATPTFSPFFASQGFAGLGALAPNPVIKPKYLSLSLGSIVGAYYLAGNTTLSAPPALPYTQATLGNDMKGVLNVPGARIAYLLRDSISFGPSIDAGLAAQGIVKGSPTYIQFFLLTQSVLDPADPATMTTPLPNLVSLAPLPSRLSGRILIQEATSTSFDAQGVPSNGDLVIPNDSTRYFGNALGGRGVLGSQAALAVAPDFDQLSYLSGRLPALFMLTLSGTAVVPKTAPAASIPTAPGPLEGYFQFDQAQVTHGFLLDPTSSPTATQFAQAQMVSYLLFGRVIDPSASPAKLAARALGASGPGWQVTAPPVMRVFSDQLRR
jgi:hypothetical protein